jgi:hypothetical protein
VLLSFVFFCHPPSGEKKKDNVAMEIKYIIDRREEGVAGARAKFKG